MVGITVRALMRNTIMGSAIASSLTASAAEPLKVAFVYVSPTTDGGWTQQHESGRQALQNALGSKIKTTYVENIPETADVERILRQLVADGNQLIFAASYGYNEPVLKVAKLFPKVKFEVAAGVKTSSNVSVYEPRLEEGYYMIGIIAGQMTKTNTLGFIASFPIPTVVRNIDAMTLGAQAVNPRVKTRPIYVNTWYDPGKERQAADTLIAQGADAIAQNTDSPASIQAAQEKGTYAFCIDADMSKFGKKAQLTGSIEDWGPFYIAETEKVLNGSWTGDRHTRWGLKEGLVVLAPLSPDIPPAVVKVFEEKKNAILEGKLNPFSGPIRDNEGAEMVAAGQTLPKNEFDSLRRYVAGVEGSLSK